MEEITEVEHLNEIVLGNPPTRTKPKQKENNIWE